MLIIRRGLTRAAVYSVSRGGGKKGVVNPLAVKVISVKYWRDNDFLSLFVGIAGMAVNK